MICPNINTLYISYNTSVIMLNVTKVASLTNTSPRTLWIKALKQRWQIYPVDKIKSSLNLPFQSPHWIKVNQN